MELAERTNNYWEEDHIVAKRSRNQHGSEKDMRRYWRNMMSHRKNKMKHWKDRKNFSEKAGTILLDSSRDLFFHQRALTNWFYLATIEVLRNLWIRQFCPGRVELLKDKCANNKIFQTVYKFCNCYSFLTKYPRSLFKLYSPKEMMTQAISRESQWMKQFYVLTDLHRLT